ncbi:MAG: serine protease MucD [Nevskia sp.]
MRITPGLGAVVLLLALPLISSCGHRNAGVPDFADLVEQVSPSVVNISAVAADPDIVASSPGSSGGSPNGGNGKQVPDWLRKFLEQHGEGATPADPKAPKRGDAQGDDGDLSRSSPDGPDSGGDGGPGNGEQSLGSGFILWSDGYILTNHHVVKDSKEVVVRLSDRRQFEATIVGSDERSDLALLKIDAKNLPAVKIGNVAKSRVGEWVLAIGSPFGFDYTVTTGILSAKNRNLDTEQYVPFLQTDAAVNPGNSGGPLFNLKGEVLGINSQIYSQNGGFQGVAFAIPIDVATTVAKALKDHGKVIRGWLGIVMQEVDRNLAKSFGMDKPGGALIARILPDSPAEQAGLKAGDVVLKYNGEEVVSYRTLKPLVGRSLPGETITLELLRESKVVTVKVEVGTLEAGDDANPPVGKDGLKKKPSDPVTPNPSLDRPLGVGVQTLTDEERRAAKVVSGGVRVVDVSPGPAREAGLIPGDVILSIASQEIATAERYVEVVGRLTPGQSVPVLVQRQGAPLFLALAVPAKATTPP